MRLFIDCDDTLVLWGEHKEGQLYRGDLYKVNTHLISATDLFLNVYPDTQLIVWSGGGAGYATMWARKFFGGQRWVGLAKDIALPQLGDWVVDDQPLKLLPGVFLGTWEEFVVEVEEAVSGFGEADPYGA